MSYLRWQSIAVLILALHSESLFAAPWDYEGKIVGEIRFDPEAQPLLVSELNLLVGIPTGQPLTAAAVRTAIQRLYATGRYDELQVDAMLRDGKVVLTFFTKQNWFINRVTVEGVAEPPNREQLVGATKLELGTLYTESKMAEAMQGLRDLMRANGFYSPRIQPLVERYPDFDELHVQFLLSPGQRAYFARPNITGNLKLKEEDILGTSRWKRWWGMLGWKEFTDERVQSGIARIRRSYLNKDFLLAKVDLTALQFQRDTYTVRPELNIDAGPKVELITSGAKLSKGKLKELVPVYQEQSVDQDLLEEGSRKIAQFFQARGYFDTEVDYTRQQNGTQGEKIEYAIDRGDRFKLVHIAINGNRYFDTATIRERMNIVLAGRLVNRSGRFSEVYLDRDRTAIRELYRSNGFQDAKVTTRVERGYQKKEFQVAVYFDIEEGEQVFVNSLDISGVDLRLFPYLQSILTSTEGQPYSALNIATDRDNILNYYYDSGYPDASMDISAQPVAGNDRMMDVKYVVQEGRRQFVRDVHVNGLVATKASLVASRISLVPGAPLSLSSMVFSQRRLYDLGIFAKVDMALVNPQGSVREKRVLYQFEEASRWSLNGGIGAEFGRFGGSATSLSSPAGGTGFAPRVSVGFSRLNFLGLGHTVGVQTRFSSLQTRGLVTYLAPRLQNRENFYLTLTALYDDSHNVRTFSSRRLEGALQVSQRFSRATQAQYRFVFRRVSTSDVKIEPGLIPLYSQPVRVGLVSGTLIHDRRDDPLNATRGYYFSLDLSNANRAFGSQTSFGRLLGRNSSFHRLTREFVLSRNTTAGWIANYGGTDIPLPERFFAGGAVSHRGFPENQAGPRDLFTGFPLGGRALLFNQTELRFPFIGNNVGGVLFHDAGNVYTRVNDISFRFRQRDLTDFDYMVHAVGFGVRYRTPIGPIRLDFAYGLNSPRFEGYQGSLNDLINNLGQRVDQRVSRFQFHFSLGQAF